MALMGPGTCPDCGKDVLAGDRHEHIKFPWVPEALFEASEAPGPAPRELWS